MVKKSGICVLCIVILLMCASCGPGGIALLAALAGGGGGGGKKSSQYRLTIESDYGEPQPPVGTHYFSKNSHIFVSCGTSPYPGSDPSSGTRYSCKGFDATGSGLPQSGDALSFEFNITENTRIRWNWEVQHRLDIDWTPSAGGSVAVDPPPPLGDKYYTSGSTLKLTATPSKGYNFYRWTGDASGNQNSIDIIMDSYKHITAEFVELPVADFYATKTVFYGGSATVNFVNSSTGDIVRWDWDFDGDGTFDRTDYVKPTSFNWIYQNPGVYTVTLKVTGPANDTDMKTIVKYIKVYGDTVYVDANNGDDVNNFGTTLTDALKTIQKGIDVAEDGMTVSVADGTYNETNIDFKGKFITVKSQNGAQNCIIDCQSSGRGFYFHSGETSNSVLDGFTIKNGQADVGGGIQFYMGSPIIQNCIIEDCKATEGGGIYCSSNSSPTIRNCIIRGNNASVSSGCGGGIVCYSNGSPTFINCLIVDNSAVYGGGVHCYSSTLKMINCTIVNNSASRLGGGIFFMMSSKATIANTIIWGNSATNGGNQGWIDDAGTVVKLFNCCRSDNPTDGGGDHGPIEVDPIFAPPDFRDPSNKDFRLNPGSYCFDKGNRFLLPDGVTTDLDGNPRVSGINVDIGAYELKAVRVPTEKTTIQSGIDAANDLDVVLLASGTYKGAGNKNLDFKGKKIAVRSEFGPELTVIDCEDNGRGFIFQSGETEISTLDGVKIRRGYVTTGDGGGGILCTGTASPTIRNCIIEYCDVLNGSGGGISCTGNSHPTIICCEIGYNFADYSGGGIFVFSDVSPSAPIKIFNCLIRDNDGENGGGGGIYIRGNNTCYVNIFNCTIVRNDSSGGGDGGGIFVGEKASATITNCIIWDNTGGQSVSYDIYVSSLALTSSIQYTDVDNSHVFDAGGLLAWGDGIINANPQFLNSGDDYHLKKGSPCVEAGDNSVVSWYFDLDVKAFLTRKRIWGSKVDLGCYEGAWIYVPSTSYQTIQSGIDGASDGDVVLVAAGKYEGSGNKDIRFWGKRVLLLADSKKGDTVIDCKGSGTAFVLDNNEKYDTIICGFEITNANPLGTGGGVACSNASSTFINCFFRNNKASSHGGAVYLTNNGSLTFVNCLFENNEAGVNGMSGGGAIYCTGSILRLINCTLTGNKAQFGGGLRTTSNSYALALNSIIWGNTDVDGGANISHEINNESSELLIGYSDVRNDTGCVVGTINWLQGNLFVDPKFVNDGMGYLTKGSPCQDVGDNGSVIFAQDPHRRPRVLNTTVDMGCYEGAILIVPTNYGKIQEAIDNAGDYDIVLVENGTYSGAGNIELTPRGKILRIASRNGPSYCTINCNHLGRGFVFNSHEDEQCIVDGFRIVNGFSNTGIGSAIYCDSSGPRIVNCVIDSCSATVGAIGCINYANPIIWNCEIKNNTSSSGGGAIYCANNSRPSIVACIITSNSAVNGHGGGIYCQDSSPIFMLCTIRDNSANSGGGAVYCSGHSNPIFVNCLIANNETTGSGMGGGGIYCYNNIGTVSFYSCTIANNYCKGDGGAIFNYTSSSVSRINLFNSILWGNKAVNFWNGVASLTNSEVNLYSSCHTVGTNENGGSGSFTPDLSCISADPSSSPNYPQFVNLGSQGVGGGGDFRITIGSPCRNTGNNAYIFWETDLDNKQRIIEGIVDMGAYEY